MRVELSEKCALHVFFTTWLFLSESFDFGRLVVHKNALCEELESFLTFAEQRAQETKLRSAEA